LTFVAARLLSSPVTSFEPYRSILDSDYHSTTAALFNLTTFTFYGRGAVPGLHRFSESACWFGSRHHLHHRTSFTGSPTIARGTAH